MTHRGFDSHLTYQFSKYIMAKPTFETIFIENPTFADSTIKQFYLNYRDTNNIPYACDGDNCGISDWHGKPLNLQLEHKNGIHSDGRLLNLALLCPNCHSQTSTFCGKNKWSHVSDDQLIDAINKSINARQALQYATLNTKRSDYFSRAKSLANAGKASFKTTTYDVLFK